LIFFAEFGNNVKPYSQVSTDGLAIPAFLSAAKAGAKIFDVQEDSLVRFYGHSPMLRSLCDI
jgi:hypothetical protein